MTEFVEWLTATHDNFVIEWRRLIDQKWGAAKLPLKVSPQARSSLVELVLLRGINSQQKYQNVASCGAVPSCPP
jgi:hypothetical protein